MGVFCDAHISCLTIDLIILMQKIVSAAFRSLSHTRANYGHWMASIFLLFQVSRNLRWPPGPSMVTDWLISCYSLKIVEM